MSGLSHGTRRRSRCALNRFTVHEQAIGCENCHGPGSLHQELRRRGPRARGEEDLTIVHPGRLPRPLQEAICSACHLGDPAIVAIRGREIGDFEPGRPLNDFRIHYRLEGGGDSMSVVGHVDQMHQSACYRKSEMTCLTCHDPHLRQTPADRVSFFRERCQSCHETRPCTLDRTARLAQEPRDDCAACHMPQSEVDAPHVAFTQHRIAVHTRLRHPSQRTSRTSWRPRTIRGSHPSTASGTSAWPTWSSATSRKVPPTRMNFAPARTNISRRPTGADCATPTL